jgi:hypothetical protein
MIIKDINKEIDDFKTKQIQVVPGLSFNQYDTIQKIYFYYSSKFSSGDIDDEGDRKYFFNINRNPCKVFSKAIDFDTKNIRLITAGGGNPNKTWFMERDLKYWMRKQGFGKILNRIFTELPIFGSVVLKIVDGKPEFVDLRNFVITQSANNLESANYVTEIHNYTPIEFRKIAKNMKWKESDVDKVIDEFHKMKDTSHIRLYERYGEVVEESETGKKSYPYKRTFIADVGIDEYDSYGNLTIAHPGVELSSDDWTDMDLPYWEFHAEKIPGRWLGIGVVETLFEPQIRINEISNLQAKASYWSALRVFQTRDAAVNRNFKTDVRNGELLNVDSEITQVDMSDRNLAYFNQEHDKYMQNRSELTFSYDVVQGERLPAGTPLGSAQIATAQTMSYFEQIQENVAMDVKEMLYEVILPQFEKENNAEHTLRLVGKDLDTYADMVKDFITSMEILKLILKGKYPSNEDRDAISVMIVEMIKKGKEKIIPIPKGMYKDLEYDIDIDITGESIDTRVRAATKFAILQAITSDPTMLEDKTKRNILSSYAEDGGLNPADLFGVEVKKPEDVVPLEKAPGRAGGGVSAPQMGAPVQGSAMATV